MPWPSVTAPTKFDFKLFIHQHGFQPNPLNNLLQANGDYKLVIHPKGATSTMKIVVKKSSVIYNGLVPRTSDHAQILFSLLKII